MLPLSGTLTPAATPTSLNRSNATVPAMSQATEIITAVPPEWSMTWDGQPWNTIAETAAWPRCTRSSITRLTLIFHPSAACHSLLPEVMPLVLCSHNAAVLHTPTPSLALPGLGTCYLLTNQHSTPSMFSKLTWTPKHHLSIAFNLILFILPESRHAWLLCINSPWEATLFMEEGLLGSKLWLRHFAHCSVVNYSSMAFLLFVLSLDWKTLEIPSWSE